MKVYISCGSMGWQHFFDALNIEIVGTVDQSDFVLFTGGEDVNPELYGEVNTNSNINAARDKFDIINFNLATEFSKPKVGICRGAQFLNIMSGGSMVQDIKGHLGTHPMQTDTGKVFDVTSTHHQMMVLPKDRKDYTLIGWALNKTVPEVRLQPEVIWFKSTEALAVQYHPEYMEPYEDAVMFFHDLLRQYIVK